MAIAPGIYNTGTATVSSGGLIVSFQGVPNLQAVIRPGDRFGGHVGFGIRIAAVGEDAVTLAHQWPGAAQTAAPYEIVFTPYDLSYREEFYEIIKRYGRGALPAMAELVGSDGAVPVFTGPQTMGLLTPQDLTQGARYDVQVAVLVDRAAYDNREEGFAVLVGNVGDGRAAIYSRVGPAGNWSAPAYITGPAITLDITEVDEVPYGAPPDATLTPKSGGYDLAFEIPRGMIIEPGTTTTLAPGQPAQVNFVPITGGYRLDISLPKGDTGEITGLTPFWQTRVSTDANATEAQTGLGATATGRALFTAANQSAARTAIGATTTGSNLIIAANAGAGRTAIEAVGYTSQTLTAPQKLQARNNIGAQEDLGWRPIQIVDVASSVAAIVVAIPSGIQHIRLSGRVKTSTISVATRLRVGTSASSFISTGYTRSTLFQLGTEVLGEPNIAQTSFVLAFENGDIAFPTQIDAQIDIGLNPWFVKFTGRSASYQGSPAANVLAFYHGWLAGHVVPTHLQIFPESGNIAAGTKILIEGM